METVVDPGAVLLDELAAIDVERARLDAKSSAKMLEFDDLRRRESEWTDNVNMRKLEVSFAAEEIGAVQCQSGNSVTYRLAEARRVRRLLPQTWLAHLRGEIDGWRVRLIASTVYSLVEPASLVKLDAEVVAYAAKHTPTQTKAWLRRFVARVEPDHQVKRAKRGLADRAVWFDHQDDGLSWMHAMMPTADAVRIDQGLTHDAKLLPSDGRTLDTPTLRPSTLGPSTLGPSTTGEPTCWPTRCSAATTPAPALAQVPSLRSPSQSLRWLVSATSPASPSTASSLSPPSSCATSPASPAPCSSES